eukprot:TRINITY_DN61751_c0_g1_i1.p1 TRINITY_DN61751_c0_g1~~TRINITY_DN61751_c0_g1_i1.p1  ORF type:complete len:335 (+),score=86.35 TRINITY_DN61751_c0_g1_i1:76-1080(+)
MRRSLGHAWAATLTSLRRAAVLSSHLQGGGLRRGAVPFCCAAPLVWAEGMGERATEKVEAKGFQVALVPCLSDNYCPILHDPRPGGATIIVDTPCAKTIIAELRKRQWTPTHILNTHHHDDHAGGNEEIVAAFPGIQVLGPKEQKAKYTASYPPPGEYVERIPALTREVAEGDTVQVGNLSAQVLAVGGHTQGHVAYFLPQVPLVFAGDALFVLGCGRVFTGDFARMTESMKKLRALPGDSVVYCAHEYTASNAKFAVQVEPDNADLQGRVAVIEQLRQQGRPTVPTVLGHELRTNPFLRFDVPDVAAKCGGAGDDVAAFTYIRRWKDTGKRPQ